jgi:hypothetical protein
LALLGLERDEEASLGALLGTLGKHASCAWSAAPEAEAEALLIDVDSMYGQMSWLRAQGGPRPIIALTAASRADADARLARPVSAASLGAALNEIAPRLGPARPGPAPAARTQPATPTPATARAAAPEPTVPAAPAPAPAVDRPAEPPRPHKLVDFVRAGQFPGAVRLRDSAPALVFDPTRGSFLGASQLKPLLPLASMEIAADRWQAITPHEYDRLKAELGEQPLTRLQWLAGLGASHGQLLPELSGALRFKLIKYPTTEREFPKHIRIATAMLKQLATAEDIAQTSGQPVEDVIDFINACAAIELIEAEFPAAATEPTETARGGLLGRLRRR